MIHMIDDHMEVVTTGGEWRVHFDPLEAAWFLRRLAEGLACVIRAGAYRLYLPQDDRADRHAPLTCRLERSDGVYAQTVEYLGEVQSSWYEVIRTRAALQRRLIHALSLLDEMQLCGVPEEVSL